MSKDPCWDGYVKVGMKDKDGRQVPNCVPCKDGKPKKEKANLVGMAHREFAADAWWDGLSDKERAAYVKAHPRSKYARAGAGPKKAKFPQATKYRPVPPGRADLIEQHMRAGGHVYVPSATRPLSIPGSHWEAWEKMGGHPMFRAEDKGYRMRQGKGSVYLLPGQLHTLHDDAGNPARL